MRTENRVVMFTDIKGFTAATGRQTREENARMLALHDALLSRSSGPSADGE
jgi:class 3 adenylate cyclase